MMVCLRGVIRVVCVILVSIHVAFERLDIEFNRGVVDTKAGFQNLSNLWDDVDCMLEVFGNDVECDEFFFTRERPGVDMVDDLHVLDVLHKRVSNFLDIDPLRCALKKYVGAAPDDRDCADQK